MKLNNEKIDDLLIKRCWNDCDLADAVGVTPAALYYQRYKVRAVRKATLGKIAKALEVDYTNIILEEEPQPAEKGV